MFLLRLFFTLHSLLAVHLATAQLVLNEISQGPNGSKEYIELVVTGSRTCTDSTADLRGWIIDDQNGWWGGLNTGISTGHFRFDSVSSWECIPLGSILLIYHEADKNASILLPDDPTDANGDGVYVLPIGHPHFRRHTSQPLSPSSPSFVYPETGYGPGTASWSLHLGQNNLGDAFLLIAPWARDSAAFSFVYLPVLPVGARQPSVYLNPGPGAGQVAIHTGSDPFFLSNWIVANVSTSESPGAPNSLSNAAWIGSLRTAPPLPPTLLYGCIRAGESYSFGGINQTVAGWYADTILTTGGCDSILRLYLTVSTNQTTILSDCGVVTSGSTVFTSDTTLRDTLRSNISACDSVYLVFQVRVHSIPQLRIPEDTTVCLENGLTLTATTNIGSVRWTGFTPGASIRVQPNVNTVYEAIALSTNGCADTATVQVEVENFNIQLMPSATRVLLGETLTFVTSASTPYSVLRWLPNDLFGSSTDNVESTVLRQSTRVSAVAQSLRGCVDTASAMVAVEVKGVFLPSAFSPNGDGVNDQWRIISTIVRSVHLEVWNRWGQNLFRSNDTNRGWDGKVGAVQAPAGTYVYRLDAVLQDGSRMEKNGTVTLVR